MIDWTRLLRIVTLQRGMIGFDHMVTMALVLFRC